MTRWWRILLGLVLLALMIEIVLIAPRHLGQPEDVAASLAEQKKLADGPESKKAELVIDGAHYLEWEVKGESKEWELWANRAVRLRDEKVYRIDGVKVQFLKQNEVAYNVKGDHGEIHEDAKDLIIRGHVVTTSANGYRFETESMTYNSGERVLTSSSNIRMTGPKDEEGTALLLTGCGMTANLNTNIIHVLSNVRASKMLSRKRDLIITSERAEMSGVQDVARFFGHVVMDVDSVRITGPQMEFKYNAANPQNIDSVIVRQGARLTDVDKWATANEISYDVVNNLYVFEGSPRVVQHNDELIGDRIVFNEATQEIEVSNMKAKVDKQRIEKAPQ